MWSAAVRWPCALTVWPPGSMTPRVVARKARRLSASESDVKPFQAAEASALGRHPSPRTARPTVSTRSRTQLDAMTGSTSSAPGSVAERSSGLTDRPRPPLETRTSASTRSGKR